MNKYFNGLVFICASIGIVIYTYMNLTAAAWAVVSTGVIALGLIAVGHVIFTVTLQAYNEHLLIANKRGIKVETLEDILNPDEEDEHGYSKNS